MCKFCENWHDKNTICGADIKINKCANETNLTCAQIMKNTCDKVPGIVIYKNVRQQATLILYFVQCVAGSWWKNETIRRNIFQSLRE